MSNLDTRVLLALRRIYDGDFIYGEDTGQAELLGSYCKELGLPEELGDPTKSIPIPCLVGLPGPVSSFQRERKMGLTFSPARA